MPVNIPIRNSLHEASRNVIFADLKMSDPSVRWEEESSGTNDSKSDTDREDSLVMLFVQY